MTFPAQPANQVMEPGLTISVPVPNPRNRLHEAEGTAAIKSARSKRIAEEETDNDNSAQIRRHGYRHDCGNHIHDG